MISHSELRLSIIKGCAMPGLGRKVAVSTESVRHNGILKQCLLP